MMKIKNVIFSQILEDLILKYYPFFLYQAKNMQLHSSFISQPFFISFQLLISQQYQVLVLYHLFHLNLLSFCIIFYSPSTQTLLFSEAFNFNAPVIYNQQQFFRNLLCPNYWITGCIADNNICQKMNNKRAFKTNIFDRNWTINFQRIQNNLNTLLLTDSCDTICKSQKPTSGQLIYLLKCLRFLLIDQEGIEVVFRQWMRKLVTLLKSTQYESYGQKLPIFWFVLSKYGFKNFQHLQKSVQEKKPLKESGNSNTFHYTGLDALQISIDQLCFLRNKKCNIFFQDLNTNQMLLQNSQCLCCSQIYIKNFQIHNSNPYIKVSMYLSGSKAFNKGVLEKYTVAACNSGGGVILIGAQKRKGQFKAIGIKFTNQQGINEKEKQIFETLKKVAPKCEYKVERVIVHTNYVTCQNVARQYMRICFRIFVLPECKSKASYFEICKKGSENNYEIYVQQKSKPLKTANSQIYNFMHLIYKKGFTKMTNSHRNIECLRPHLYYSQIFNEYFTQGIIQEQELYQSDSSQQAEDDGFIDQPTFKFSKNSLLIVSSQNQEKYIRSFCKFLSENPEVTDNIDLQKLYAQSFPENQRSVWLISHEIPYSQLKASLAEFIQKGSLKPETITMMPTHSILQVQISKFSQHIEQILKKRMTARFSDSMNFARKKSQIYDHKHHEKKKIYYLKFPNLTLSLYAYMILQSSQLRPYFVPEEDYQSKP